MFDKIQLWCARTPLSLVARTTQSGVPESKS